MSSEFERASARRLSLVLMGILGVLLVWWTASQPSRASVRVMRVDANPAPPPSPPLLTGTPVTRHASLPLTCASPVATTPVMSSMPSPAPRVRAPWQVPSFGTWRRPIVALPQLMRAGWRMLRRIPTVDWSVPTTAFLNGETSPRLGLPDGHVALTFDDGPHAKLTPRVLDILDRYQVKATFFLVGKQARRNPKVVQEIIRRGHTVASHTHSHALLTSIPYADARAEILLGHQEVLLAAGPLADQVTPLFRFPGGQRYAGTRHKELLVRQGLVSVRWNLSAHDSRAHRRKGPDSTPAARAQWHADIQAFIFNAAMEDLQQARGGVLILHDTKVDTVAVLPRLLDELAHPRRLAEVGIPQFTAVRLVADAAPPRTGWWPLCPACESP